MKTTNPILTLARGVALAGLLSGPATAATVQGDFNCDLITDLAVGIPTAEVQAIQRAGIVHVRYGSTSGLDSSRVDLWHQGRLGAVLGENESFGATLAAGDFNGDSCADLAVGIPNKDFHSSSGRTFSQAGAVQVLYGSPYGLQDGTLGVASQLWNVEYPYPKNHFGAALAAGDFDGNGFLDLAIGIPNDDRGEGGAYLFDSNRNAGSVYVLQGSSAGLTRAGATFWWQGKSGVKGDSEEGDHFGSALAVGNLNGDVHSETGLPIDDLVVGVPDEARGFAFPPYTIGAYDGKGAINVLYGTENGLSAYGDQLWSQNSPGVKGDDERFDRFGTALAIGDFNGDAYADVAIGSPGEEIGSIQSAGVVNVLYGGPEGLDADAIDDQLWHQDSPGIAGWAELFDGFGSALTTADFNGDSFTDLAVGVSGEDVSGRDAGVVNVIYGSVSGLNPGIGVPDNQLWHQDSPGIKETADPYDDFGRTLAAGDFNDDGRADLAVEVPGEDKRFPLQGAQPAGAVQILYGTYPHGLQADNNQLLWLHSPAPSGPGGNGLGMSPAPSGPRNVEGGSLGPTRRKATI